MDCCTTILIPRANIIPFSGTVLATFSYDDQGVPTSVVLGSDPVNGPRYFYVYNGHGDVVALTDATGTVVASYSYDVFGVLTSSSESFPNNTSGWTNPYRYDGRDGVRYDGETGLSWLSVRAYDPTLGHFLQHDPLGRAPLFFADQPYAYAGNNPLINVDPSGQMAFFGTGDMAARARFEPKWHRVPRPRIQTIQWCNLACEQNKDKGNAKDMANRFHDLATAIGILGFVVGVVLGFIAAATADPWVLLSIPAVGYAAGMLATQANDFAAIFDEEKGWDPGEFNRARIVDEVQHRLDDKFHEYAVGGVGAGMLLTIARFVVKLGAKFKLPFSVLGAAAVVVQLFGSIAMYRYASDDVYWQEQNLPLCPVGCS